MYLKFHSNPPHSHPPHVHPLATSDRCDTSPSVGGSAGARGLTATATAAAAVSGGPFSTAAAGSLGANAVLSGRAPLSSNAAGGADGGADGGRFRAALESQAVCQPWFKQRQHCLCTYAGLAALARPPATAPPAAAVAAAAARFARFFKMDSHCFRHCASVRPVPSATETPLEPQAQAISQSRPRSLHFVVSKSNHAGAGLALAQTSQATPPEDCL